MISYTPDNHCIYTGKLRHTHRGAVESEAVVADKVNMAWHMAHTRQSRPDSGLGVQVKDRQTFEAVPTSLGSSPGFALGEHHLGLIDFVYDSTLGLGVIKKRRH